MNETIGLPKLKIAFEAAAQAVANRSKKGYVGVIVRDEKAQGLHKLSSDTMIPLELGEVNKAHIKAAFEGSDRGRPSLVYLVVIPPATEGDTTTTALESGLKHLEAVSVDYLAVPADVTDAELTVMDTWTKAQRAAYRTVKLVRPLTGEGSDDMGIIQLEETGLKVLGKAVTPASYCARMAGILAGIPMSMSATYAALPEVTAVTERSEA